jgi:hypothetical protein
MLSLREYNNSSTKFKLGLKECNNSSTKFKLGLKARDRYEMNDPYTVHLMMRHRRNDRQLWTSQNRNVHLVADAVHLKAFWPSTFSGEASS